MSALIGIDLQNDFLSGGTRDAGIKVIENSP
jgi:hypothetical protein